MCTELLDTRFSAATRNKNNQPASPWLVLASNNPRHCFSCTRGRCRMDACLVVWLGAGLCCADLHYCIQNKRINLQSLFTAKSHHSMAIIYFSTPPPPRPAPLLLEFVKSLRTRPQWNTSGRRVHLLGCFVVFLACMVPYRWFGSPRMEMRPRLGGSCAGEFSCSYILMFPLVWVITR